MERVKLIRHYIEGNHVVAGHSQSVIAKLGKIFELVTCSFFFFLFYYCYFKPLALLLKCFSMKLSLGPVPILGVG